MLGQSFKEKVDANFSLVNGSNGTCGGWRRGRDCPEVEVGTIYLEATHGEVEFIHGFGR